MSAEFQALTENGSTQYRLYIDGRTRGFVTYNWSNRDATFDRAVEVAASFGAELAGPSVRSTIHRANGNAVLICTWPAQVVTDRYAPIHS